MSTVVVVSAYTDQALYARCVLDNPFLAGKDNVVFAGFDNSQDNQFISRRYNQFLDRWDYAREAWFVFCHSDWEALEDLPLRLEDLDKNVLWGPIGAKLLKNEAVWKQIYCGVIQERSRDGTESRTLWNRHNETGTPVDTFDAQCLIVHSSLIQRLGLRFDENYRFDMYVEDFCVQALENFDIPSRILKLKCCHHNIIHSMAGRDAFYEMADYFNAKWSPNGGAWGEVVMALGKIERPVTYVHPTLKDNRAAIYKKQDLDALIENPNDAMTLAFEFIEPGSRVLDAGCAAGDLGVLLHERKNCRVFGMDYNPDSVQLALATGCFEGCRQVNLDTFDIAAHQDIGQFDYIILGDVCEHLRAPVESLLKLKSLLKPGGAFCLSIPNVAHASIKAALLLDRWDYADVGLMDRTHIHMFSWKGIARELADATLAIERVRPTFFPVDFLLRFNPFLFLSSAVRRSILRDIHSYVGQYVLICRPSNAFDVEASNLKVLNLRKEDFADQIKRHGKCRGGFTRRMALTLKIKFHELRFARSKNPNRRSKYGRKMIDNLEKLSA